MFARITLPGQLVRSTPRGAGAGARGFNVLLSIALVCGVAASLALGVLIAYGLCIAMFTLFRIHAQHAAAARVAAAPPSGLRTVQN